MATFKNNYVFQFINTLTVSDSTVTISNDLERSLAVSFTNASVTIVDRLDNPTKIERTVCTASAWTVTFSLRWLDQSETKTEVTALKKERRPWSYGFVTMYASDMFDKDNPEALVFADTTARDTALWADWAATNAYFWVYTTSEWLHRNYNLSSNVRESVDTWTTTPNASVTVAWKVEEATDAELWAWTETWATWARLFINPASTVKTSSWSWDENKLAVLDATWKLENWFIAITWEIRLWSAAAAPTWYLLCDWLAVSRTTYATLFALISTTYWVGDWSTTFNIPDLQWNTPVWKDSWTFSTLGWTWWAETHTLTETEMPSHTHTYNWNSSGTFKPWTVSWDQSQDFSSRTSWSTWWWTAHNILQPYLVLNYIIKY